MRVDFSALENAEQHKEGDEDIPSELKSFSEVSEKDVKRHRETVTDAFERIERYEPIVEALFETFHCRVLDVKEK